jgi:MFS family permease
MGVAPTMTNMASTFSRQNLPFGMMFALQFGALGCWLPVFSLHLQDTLEFSGPEIGTILGVSSAAALFSPFIGALLSDRYITARYLMALCHGVAGGMILWCSWTPSFLEVLVSMTLYQLVFTPSFALCNSITFRFMEGGREGFGLIRVWGTISWMLVAWILAVLLKVFPGGTSLALQASALCSFGMVLLCLGLPSAEKVGSKKGSRFESLKLPPGIVTFFMSPPVVMLSLASFLISMTFRFHFTGGGPYLSGVGCRVEWVLPALSAAQILELWLLFRLKHHLKRWGYFGLMGLGGLICMVQFSGLALNPGMGLAIFLMMGHGVTFTYFSTALLMWMDTRVEKELHSSVHQLVVFIPSLAGVVGGYVSGWMLEPAEKSANYIYFYGLPAGAALIVLFLVLGAKWGENKVMAKRSSFE